MEQPAASTPGTETIPSGLKNAVTVVTLVLCWVLIGYIVLKGDPANSLQQSALAWAFAVQMGVLAGLGFGAIVEYLPSFGKRS